jgi:hypothetical protein
VFGFYSLVAVVFLSEKTIIFVTENTKEEVLYVFNECPTDDVRQFQKSKYEKRLKDKQKLSQALSK